MSNNQFHAEVFNEWGIMNVQACSLKQIQEMPMKFCLGARDVIFPLCKDPFSALEYSIHLQVVQ